MKLNIGENIKKLRALRNATQEELAEHLGISYQAVSRWEKGQCYPDIELIPLIANYFEVGLDELMGGRQSKEEIDKIISKTSEICYHDNATALSALRELHEQFPHNWKVKDALCSALTAGIERKQFLGEDADYNEVLPEIRKFCWEARMKFDKEAVHGTQWLYRHMVLCGPDDEAEEWADQIESNVYNTKLYNLFLRYRDYRKDAQKAAYWQRMALPVYMQMFDSLFRPSNDSDEGWAKCSEMTAKMYDAFVGIPYKENGTVYNTMYLSKRADDYSWAFVYYAKVHNDEKAVFTLKKAVDYLCLYADSLSQDRLTSENGFYDEDCEYTVHKKAYYLLDRHYANITRHPEIKNWVEHLSGERSFRENLEKLNEKRLKIRRLYKSEVEKLRQEGYWFLREEE